MASGQSYGTLMTINFQVFFIITLSLPLGGLIICVLLALFTDFDRAVNTHCGVANYLPSLSVAIGQFDPQRYIWRTGIALHSTPRICFAVMYLNFYRSSPTIRNNPLLWRLAILNCGANLVEVFALILLSYVSSAENFGIHKNMFACFLLFSVLHMLGSITLFRRICADNFDADISRSLTWKKRLAAANLLMGCLAMCFYYLHNAHCPPGVYTLFALCEYLVVLSNILFHGTAYFDFEDYLIIAKSSEDEYAYSKLESV